MPRLNHTGPEGEGAKTGRKLGVCRKTDAEKSQMGELGKGMGKRHKSPNEKGSGKGKRLQYNK